MIVNDLKNKRRTIETLKRKLEESEEKCKRLEANMSIEEKEIKNKFLTYEKNLE